MTNTNPGLFHRQYYRDMAKDIPVIILAGGLGTRLAEETHQIPKPMVKIGEMPIILHIMDYYARFGFKNFVVCGGYRIEAFKEYFVNLPFAGKDLEISFSKQNNNLVATPSTMFAENRADWKVTILETGLKSMTGFRIAKATNYLQGKGYRRFAVTYGDGLTDVDLHKQMAFHCEHKKIGTVLGVHQPTRFGIFKLHNDGLVREFSEKPQFSNEFINGGFFLFENDFDRYIDSNDDQCIFEQTPLVRMSKAGELFVYRHEGFWQCMDTMREKLLLEDLAKSGHAPWMRLEPLT